MTFKFCLPFKDCDSYVKSKNSAQPKVIKYFLEFTSLEKSMVHECLFCR